MAKRIPFGPSGKIIFERTGVASGAIRRQDGQFREYSVIYTGSDKVLLPGDLTATQLLGATLENTELPSSETDRFYTILGGYYFEYLSNGNTRISNVFGVALRTDLGFTLTEGSSQELSDQWELKFQDDNKIALMDEEEKGERNKRDPGYFGWTLIADEVKPESLRPKSGKQVKFYVNCPEITAIVQTSSDQTADNQLIGFEVQTDLPAEGATFTWNWGDGSSEETSEQTTAQHTFARPEGEDQTLQITVSLQTEGGCEDAFTLEISLPKKCPAIKSLVGEVTETKRTSVSYLFTATLEGSATPVAYLWTIGNNAPISTSVPTLSHVFDRLEDEEGVYQVGLQLQGPDPCESQQSIEVTIPEEVDIHLQLSKTYLEPDAATQPVSFVLEVDGIEPDTYEWDLGDGTQTKTKDNSLLHGYLRPDGEAELRTMQVFITGPDGFISETQTTVVQVPGICPVLTSVTATQEESTETDSPTYSLTVLYSGPAPTSFHWLFGDGQTADTEGPIVSHTYLPVAGQEASLEIIVSASGPDACTTNEVSTQILLQPLCPFIEGIDSLASELAETELSISFTAQISGPAPDRFVWNFGDGQTKETTAPTVVHAYTRPGGDLETYPVRLQVFGPGSCTSAEVTTEVSVPGICPVITGIVVEEGVSTEIETAFTFTAQLQGPTPSKYTWGLAGGISIDTESPVLAHLFPKIPGENSAYLVTVWASGPEHCISNTQSTEVQTAAICPVTTDLKVTYLALEDVTSEVKLEVIFEGPTPTGFIWNFGNAETVTTTAAEVIHHFARAEGKDTSYLVEVSTAGPGVCVGKEMSATIEVPGTCPVLTEIAVTYDAPAETAQTVTFIAAYSGPAPAAFEWNFGNGQTDSTPLATTTHTYTRPIGNDTSLNVTVKASGPGACISSEISQAVLIPRLCPEVISLVAHDQPLEDSIQQFSFILNLSGPLPDSITWNWGDGSATENSTTPTAKHAYDRKPGDGNAYLVTVTTQGPGVCTGSAETTVQVPGLCPEITSIDLSTGLVTEESQEVIASLQLAHTTAASYQWNWGDGSAVQTTEVPSASHVFTRQPGDPTTYTLTVSTTGPGSCKAMSGTTVEVQGRCPELNGLSFEILTPTEKIVPVVATAVTGSLLPATFFWNWGDGSPEESSLTPNRQHNYARIPGDAVSYQVSVRTSGPGACTASISNEVSVPGICPDITGLVPIFSPATELGQTVTVTLQTSGPAATSFLWNWGDGSSEESKEGVASHFYARVLGVEKNYRMAVEATGPGSCLSQASLQISVAALCPLVEDIDVQYDNAQPLTQKIDFTIGLRHGNATSYVWDWADGTPAETSTTATVSHIFSRQPGDARQYLVRVRIEGPGPCLSTATVQVKVAGICPEIKALNTVFAPSTNDQQAVQFQVIAENVTQDVRFLWNWDDGSAPETTTLDSATHLYTRYPGDSRSYTPRVTLLGPQSCECPAATRIEVAGLCPKIDAFEVVSGSLTEATYEISVNLTISETIPDKLIWTWGDGITETTTTNQATHVFTRQPGDSKPYTLLVQVAGPGKCGDSKEIPLLVPGFCPVIAQLALTELLTELETEYPVSVVATITRTPAATYLWDWGDGSTDLSTTPEYTHVYQRVIGELLTYQIIVTAQGPDSCSSQSTLEIMVLGYCPRVEETIVTKEEPEETTQEVSVNLQMAPAEATAYTWNWGDGSTEEATTDPYSSHVYTRLPGDPLVYPITIQFSGPGTCSGLQTTEVEIPGVCPKVMDIAITYGDQTLENQFTETSLTLALAEADRYVWNWGDGTITETTLPTAVHSYARFPGDTKSYPVDVQLFGPGKCINGAAITAEIPGYCPVPSSLTVVDDGMGTLQPKLQTITVLLEARDATPDTYHWNWGDGQLTTTTTPTASHTYDRPQGEAIEYTVTAVLVGPDFCKSQISTAVQIQGKCPLVLAKSSVVTASLETTEGVLFSLTVEDWEKVRPGTVTFTWSWKDAAGVQTQDTSVPEISVAFLRPYNDTSYQVDVQMAGPGICHFQTCFHVFVAGTCPVIEAVETRFCGGDDAQLVVHLQATFRAHPKPTGLPVDYVWEWGDGTPATLTDSPSATHSFKRPLTGLTEFQVKVSANGPGCNCATGFSRTLQIPGDSPVVVGWRAIYAQPSLDIQPVSLLAVVRGGKPQRYEWNFGDGSPVVTTLSPSVVHEFFRIQDAYLVKVTIKGKVGSSDPWEHHLQETLPIPLPNTVAKK